MKDKLNWWQLALVALGVSALGALSTKSRKVDERKVYTRDLKQAPWAPPPWLFGPAWTINNFFLLQGLQKILNKKNTVDQKTLLYLQGGIWIIFFSFGYVYFKKKSPVLAAVWTLSDAALAATSFKIANKQDKTLSYQYLPLLGWTSFASSIAVYQALKNPDPVVHTEAVA